MEYPYPGPEPSTYLRWGIILTLLGCLALPIAHVLWHRCKTTSKDAVLGVAAAFTAVIVASLFPFEQYGFPDRMGSYVLMTAWMAIVANFVWAASTSGEVASHWSSQWTIISIYGASMGVAAISLAYTGCSTPREAARRMHCKSKLKQVGFALHNYHDEYQKFPDLVTVSPDPARSWRVDLLPYLELSPLRERYVDASEWNHESNLPIATTRAVVYGCPSAIEPADAMGRRYSAYAGVSGSNTLFPDGRGLTFQEITDGSSNTIMVVEACGREIVWTEPRDVDAREQKYGVNLPGEKPGRSQGLLSSYHKDGAFAVFGDGSVRYISKDIDADVLRAMSTATGGESSPLDY